MAREANGDEWWREGEAQKTTAGDPSKGIGFCGKGGASDKGAARILRPRINFEELPFYQRAVVLYQLTVVFCRRFLLRHGDRTVDQMVQAARSGKQNIVEGCVDGMTSTEMEIRLVNVALGSMAELREDYADYLLSHGLELWDEGHLRFDGLREFCRDHGKLKDYERFFEAGTDEELANCAHLLCRMAIEMMEGYLAKCESDFAENGGIRERMTAVRLGRRQTQNEEIGALRRENGELSRERNWLKAENRRLRREVAQLTWKLTDAIRRRGK